MTIRDQVRQFHEAAGCPVLDHPQVPPDDRVRLRARLVAEEFFELLSALYAGQYDVAVALGLIHRELVALIALNPTPDIVAVADALGDLDYVVEGSRLEFGIDGGPVADEIHRSNMSKFCPGARMREDGKVLKSPEFVPPDIARVLREQGRKP